MPDFKLGSGFSKGDTLEVHEITGDHLDTTAQQIGEVTVRDDGTVGVVAQRVGRYLLIGKSKTVGVIVRSDGRNQGPFGVGKDGKWARDSEATFDRLDAPLNTEQSEAQTGPGKEPGVDPDEQPPLPEDQPVSEGELSKAVKAKQKPGANTAGLTPVQAAVEERAVTDDAKAQKETAKADKKEAKKAAKPVTGLGFRSKPRK